MLSDNNLFLNSFLDRSYTPEMYVWLLNLGKQIIKCFLRRIIIVAKFCAVMMRRRIVFLFLA